MSRQHKNWTSRYVSRRTILRGAGVGLAGLAGAALVGCGGEEETPAPSTGGGGGTPAPSGTAAPTQTMSPIKRGGTLRGASRNDPRGLDPHLAVGGSDVTWGWAMTDNLVGLNREGLPDADRSLAESWEIVDGATVTFNLRSGIKFHDGSMLDAELVKMNLERQLDPAVAAVAAAALAPIEQMDVIDQNHLRVRLAGPNAAFVTLLGDRAGAILARQYLEAPVIGEGDKIIGCGAFKYDRWDRDSMVRIVRNPEYWRKDAFGDALPYLDAIEIMTIPDPNVAEANFEDGQVDMFSPDVSKVATWRNAGRLVQFDGARTRAVWLNTAIKPTDDVRFRKALSYGIDREAQNQVLQFGEDALEERPGPIPPGYKWLYEEGMSPNAPNSDPAEARKYLEASNYADDPRFETLGTASAAADEADAFYKDMWSRVGIDMVPTRSRDSTPFFEDRTVPGRISFLTMRTDPDGLLSEMFGSTGVFNPGQNTADPAYRELDDLLAAGRASFEPEERKAAYRRLSELGGEFVFAGYMGYVRSFQVAGEKIGNPEDYFSSDGRPRLNDLWLSS